MDTLKAKVITMRQFLFGLFGLWLLLARLAIPVGAGAAPALTVSPGSGPRGTAIGASASGLPAGTDHLFQFVRGGGNTNTTRLFEDRVRSDARGEIHYRYAVDQGQPGTYTVRIVSLGGTVLATAPFTVTEGRGIPTIAITPASGTCATQPALSGIGFAPGSPVEFYQQRLGERGEPVGTPRPVTRVQAGPTGGIAPFTVPTLAQDCRDAAPATPDGTRFAFTAVPPGASIDAATEPERRAIFTIRRDPADGRYFPETGHTVKGRFLAYWRAHGLSLADAGISERESLALFGYPISGEFEQRLEDGRTYTVQYFERARMEFHPEYAGTPYEVLLGQFGRRIVAGIPGAPTAPVADARQGRYFPETGHNVLDGAFLDFWRANGTLAVFGYPLTEAFDQVLEDGKRYRVQYFERARLEFHPEQGGSPYEVQLGQFGRQILGPTGGPDMPR
jgi:hypothetical protein